MLRKFTTLVILQVFSLVFLTASTAFAQKKYTTQEYIERYKALVIADMQHSKVPASITMAQGILESGSGNSGLARNARNHFGIKCHGWQGEKVYHDDDAKGECFRKYPTHEASFADHSDFLRRNQRYSSLFDLEITDYVGWAVGLKRAGYATNPKYADLLISLIEKYQLQRLDQAGLRNPVIVKPIPPPNNPRPNPTPTNPRPNPTPIPPPNNPRPSPTPIPPPNNPQPPVANKPSIPGRNTQNPTTRPNNPSIPGNTRTGLSYRSLKINGKKVLRFNGDVTLREVAARYRKVKLSKLLKYNEISNADIPLPANSNIFIQSKRRKGAQNSQKHLVKQGENMYAISQMYGIKIKKLYKMNKLKRGQQPAAGEYVSLRKKIKTPPRLTTQRSSNNRGRSSGTIRSKTGTTSPRTSPNTRPPANNRIIRPKTGVGGKVQGQIK